MLKIVIIHKNHWGVELLLIFPIPKQTFSLVVKWKKAEVGVAEGLVKALRCRLEKSECVATSGP